MGPMIIVDKSTLQSFSPEEMAFLRKHYYMNVVPVLIIEILGNLMTCPRYFSPAE